MLAYDVIFPLSEPLQGELKSGRLTDLADFIRLNARVDVRLDASVQTLDALILKPPFKNIRALDLLAELLNPLSVGVRGENVNQETAEKANYRLAVIYERENSMEQALENVRTLLSRYPETARKRDACVLKLGIYRGLKDYKLVLSTLEELKQIGGKDVEAFRYEAELAGIYFDLYAYDKSAAAYRNVISATQDKIERAEFTERQPPSYQKL